MESNWRLNVWEIGWANAGIRLAARIRSGPGTGLWIASGDYFSEYDFLLQVADTPLNGIIWQVLVPGMGPGFPWGIDVFPD